jgi:altronate dehydratase
LVASQGLKKSDTLHTLVMQEEGGTRATIEAGVAAIQAMLPRANAIKREPVSASHIKIGLECGGSDGFSGITATKPSPTIKLATNTPMFTRLEEDMDINCGKILDGLVDVQQMGQEIFEHILRTASGEKSKSELLNLGDNEFVPWHLGIVS